MAIERGMFSSRRVHIDAICRISGFSTDKLSFHLSRLNKFKMCEFWKGSNSGYSLTVHGYDVLALDWLYDHKHVQSIGRRIGVGKESQLFYALDFEGVEKVIKVHRVGLTSFIHIKKSRDYSIKGSQVNYVTASASSAKREYIMLKRLHELNLPTPVPYANNRHCVVMELIDGIDLFRLIEHPNPEKLLDDVIEFMHQMFIQLELVHSDLSEHNIIISHSDEKAYFIDFPQTIPAEHPSAAIQLHRDIDNILIYFKRKFLIGGEHEEIFDYITGGFDFSEIEKFPLDYDIPSDVSLIDDHFKE
jgi:RIO kinase 2